METLTEAAPQPQVDPEPPAPIEESLEGQKKAIMSENSDIGVNDENLLIKGSLDLDSVEGGELTDPANLKSNDNQIDNNGKRSNKIVTIRPKLAQNPS